MIFSYNHHFRECIVQVSSGKWSPEENCQISEKATKVKQKVK